MAGDTSPRYRARFPNRPESVGAIRGEVEAVARECGMDELAIQDLRLAVSEVATNAIVHGHAETDSEVVVRVDLVGEELCVVVADQGRGMLPRTDSPGLGLGLPIVSTLTNRLEVVSPGVDGRTEVHMYFASGAVHRQGSG